MKVVVLHGQKHKGSTYHVTMTLIKAMGVEEEDVQSFYFLDQKHCKGCFTCLLKGEQYCPDQDQIEPVVSAMDAADVIIMESPCYCIGVSGQLKSFLDHLAYIWMTHRPKESMFSKVGIVLSTTAGAGSRKVTKELARNMFYWGIPKVYQYPLTLGASSWQEVSEKNKEKINKKAKQLAEKVKKQVGSARPGIKTKAIFFMFHKMHQTSEWSKVDADYWKVRRWTEKKRPWKKA